MVSPALLVPIAPDDLQAGVPTHIDLLDARGNLLLRRGGVVCHPERVEELARLAHKRGLPSSGTSEPGMSIFQHMEKIAARLTGLERVWLRGGGDLFVSQVENLARNLLACCDADGDAALAQLHLDCHHGYSTLHQLLAAVVGLRLAKALDWDEPRRQSLAAAALTHDIALLQHRQVLEHEAPLTEAQYRLVQSHPEDGLTFLLHQGVRDHLWLRIVREHHETLSGDGYPRGLAGNALSEEVRVMSLADAYSAMLRPRPFRNRKLAPEVMDDLRLESGRRYDPDLVNLLIRELGIFPPGSVLRLANQEMAIAVRNNPDDPHAPHIKAVRTSKGYPFMHPVARDPKQENFSIIGVLPMETCFSLRKQVAEMWTAKK